MHPVRRRRLRHRHHHVRAPRRGEEERVARPAPRKGPLRRPAHLHVPDHKLRHRLREGKRRRQHRPVRDLRRHPRDRQRRHRPVPRRRRGDGRRRTRVDPIRRRILAHRHRHVRVPRGRHVQPVGAGAGHGEGALRAAGDGHVRGVKAGDVLREGDGRRERGRRVDLRRHPADHDRRRRVVPHRRRRHVRRRRQVHPVRRRRLRHRHHHVRAPRRGEEERVARPAPRKGPLRRPAHLHVPDHKLRHRLREGKRRRECGAVLDLRRHTGDVQGGDQDRRGHVVPDRRGHHVRRRARVHPVRRRVRPHRHRHVLVPRGRHVQGVRRAARARKRPLAAPHHVHVLDRKPAHGLREGKRRRQHRPVLDLLRHPVDHQRRHHVVPHRRRRYVRRRRQVHPVRRRVLRHRHHHVRAPRRGQHQRIARPAPREVALRRPGHVHVPDHKLRHRLRERKRRRQPRPVRDLRRHPVDHQRRHGVVGDGPCALRCRRRERRVDRIRQPHQEGLISFNPDIGEGIHRHRGRGRPRLDRRRAGRAHSRVVHVRRRRVGSVGVVGRGPLHRHVPPRGRVQTEGERHGVPLLCRGGGDGHHWQVVVGDGERLARGVCHAVAAAGHGRDSDHLVRGVHGVVHRGDRHRAGAVGAARGDGQGLCAAEREVARDRRRHRRGRHRERDIRARRAGQGRGHRAGVVGAGLVDGGGVEFERDRRRGVVVGDGEGGCAARGRSAVGSGGDRADADGHGFRRALVDRVGGSRERHRRGVRSAGHAGEGDRRRIGREVCAREVRVAHAGRRRGRRGQRVVRAEGGRAAEGQRHGQRLGARERAAERDRDHLAAARLGDVAGRGRERDRRLVVVGDGDAVARRGAELGIDGV